MKKIIERQEEPDGEKELIAMTALTPDDYKTIKDWLESRDLKEDDLLITDGEPIPLDAVVWATFAMEKIRYLANEEKKSFDSLIKVVRNKRGEIEEVSN